MVKLIYMSRRRWFAVPPPPPLSFLLLFLIAILLLFLFFQWGTRFQQSIVACVSNYSMNNKWRSNCHLNKHAPLTEGSFKIEIHFLDHFDIQMTVWYDSMRRRDIFVTKTKSNQVNENSCDDNVWFDTIGVTWRFARDHFRYENDMHI